MGFSIAIDGPAGAGKSTIAKRVARKLSFIYVDTGAMYRAMAVYFLRKGIDPEDSAAISAACHEAEVTIAYEKGDQQVLLNGENVTDLLRTEETGNMASISSANKDVRMQLLDLQRDLARKTDVIMDGRDIGTFVLPDADVKIFLTASVEARAKRRYQELKDKGVSCRLTDVTRDIAERDHRDMTRATAPLKQAPDAVLVDSSEMTVEEVTAQIIRIYEAVR